MTKTAEITVEQLVRAGRVLFGASFAPESSTWRPALRDAYRRRALETHPDRARALGRTEAELAREFGRVADAYRLLSALAAATPARVAPRRGSATARAPVRPSQPPRAAPRAAPPPPVASARHGGLPRRRLRLAEFLYYSGRVPWSAFVAAIAWQRAQRPPLGRIAVDLGFLAREDVGAILARRRADAATAERFGEYALRRGFLTRLQLLAAVGRQGRLQRRIGEYFVESGWLDLRALDAARAELLGHNARFR
ncbi:J domain-containing protein [Anaeromyxobacter sp. Fw109-5]|uniref:J domain-containing protein n=1 Tax=Anaeromyxobacter sp. (strain Fw109-5) TaxID=404589 RepID=UPI0000ED7781|nr:J domain-containing protein [Anaeromyxobacter sp. Fw109-5]ABS24555.1 heat shock protein DnaJ-like protein [Anaeromyxobacter sp. Fw109-5]